MDSAKGLVAKLTPPHAQNACGFRGEMIWTVGLAACCNYFSKKKKKKTWIHVKGVPWNWNHLLM